MRLRPHIGIETILVYRECPCGGWCATGEGAVAPRCGECGERMWPAGQGQTAGGEPLYGSDWRENRRIRGLGFRATLANEIALAEGKPLAEAITLALMARTPPEPEPYLHEREHTGGPPTPTLIAPEG